jgi:hypothetical protein
MTERSAAAPAGAAPSEEEGDGMGDLKRLLAMSRSHHSHIATLRGLAAKRSGKPMETKGDGGGGSAFTDAAELTLLRAKLAVQKSWEGERAELEQELKRKQEECLKLAAHNAQLQETARQVSDLRLRCLLCPCARPLSILSVHLCNSAR